MMLLTPVMAQEMDHSQMPQDMGPSQESTFPIGIQRMIEHQQGLAISMTYLVALLGGLISFLSPCGFVLLPMFFTAVFKDPKKAGVMAVVFSLGMLVTFTLMGIIAGFLGSFFNQYKGWFSVIAGILIAFFGVNMVLGKGFGIPIAKGRVKTKSFTELFFLGALFGVGWSPCVGPVLTGILLVAANLGNVLQSGLFLAVFSIGATLPFILLAFLSQKYDWGKSKWLQQKTKSFTIFGKKIQTNTYNLIAGFFLLIIGIITILWKGTGFFMQYIPVYINWNMATWYSLNDTLLSSHTFTSPLANTLGLLLFVVLLTFLILISKKAVEVKK
jgi:cytochrome c-type biogenesis protein